MIAVVALAIVAVTGVCLLLLGGTMLLAQSRASSFLLAFASSPAKHYAELATRFIVGSAFVVAASLMPVSVGFSVFGWLLIGTTAVLLLVPWQMHQHFAQQAVPAVLRFLPLIGMFSLACGALTLWAACQGYLA